MAKFTLTEQSLTPTPPSPGQAQIYLKTDHVVYTQDSNGIETALGTSSSLTGLSGDVSASGPGIGVATVNSVGGSSAANIHSAELSANAATSSNTYGAIVKRDGSGNFSANVITADLVGNASTSTTSGTATNFSGSLSGDVTGTQSSTVVATVGGKSASSIATSVNDTQAATSANTSSTLVKRDASGNFSAGTITASLSGNASTSTNFTGSLSGDVTGTQSSTVVSSVGGSSAANVHSAELAANAATSSNTASAIVKRDASGDFSAGVITASLVGNASTATSATSFSGSLSGDVSGGQSSTVVDFVGGKSASSVATSVNDTQAATSVNTASTIVKRDASGDFAANIITASLSGNATTSTTSTNFSGSLSGDVTGGQSSTAVVTVGGKSASAISTSVDDTQAATSVNTASTIVKRDASGNFAAGTVTANLTGNVSGNATTATTATNFSGSLSGDVTGTQSSTVVSTVGGKSAPSIATSVDDTQAATDLDTASTIMKRDASKNVHINGLVDDGANVVTWDIQNKRIQDVNGKYQLDASETLQAISLIANSDAIAQLHKTVSGSSAQFLIQNLATGGASSTDFIANADNGVDSNNYADFGINSSTFSDPSWTINGAGDGYVYNNDGQMAIGTAKVSSKLSLFTGGTLAANERMAVQDTGITTKIGFTQQIVTLTDAATIAIDASLGNVFKVTLGGNRTLGAPTNPTDGQKIVIRIIQDATGGRSLSYNAAYNFGIDVSGLTLTTAPNSINYIGAMYNAATSKWDVLAITRGY